MAEVRWTAEAATWLQNIYEYIAQDDPDTATNVVQEIYRKAESLSRFPLRGHLYRSDRHGEIRVLYHGRYRIAYVMKENEVVELLGIFHGALDIEQYL